METIATSLGIAAGGLTLFCCAGYPLRKAMKSLDGSKRDGARRMLKYVKGHHKEAGIAAAACAGGHLVLNAAVVHHMSLLGISLVAVLALLLRGGLCRSRENWLHVHRTLAALAAGILALHTITMLAWR